MLSFGERNRSDPFSYQGVKPGILPAYSALLPVQAALPAGQVPEGNGVGIAKTPQTSTQISMLLMDEDRD